MVNGEITGPRGRPADAPAPAGGGKEESAVLSIQGRLTEWHAMEPVERQYHWRGLVEWVVWLFDTYELGREYRLPKCWPHHPGLVQELWVLKCWREALYTGGGDGVANGRRAGALAQHARAWHNELRAFAAQIKYYAPKCLTGHTRATLAEVYPGDDLAAEWLAADPLGGIPAPEPSAADAGDSRDADGRHVPEIAEAAMRDRLNTGSAEVHPAGLIGVVTSFGHWWICELEAGTWQRVDDARLADQLDLLADNYADEEPDAENLSHVQNRGGGAYAD